MTEVKIVTEEKEEAKPVEAEDVRETLKAADEYEKRRLEVEKLEALHQREQDIKAKMAIGGKSEAGQAEKSQQEKDDEEAKKLISAFDEE